MRVARDLAAGVLAATLAVTLAACGDTSSTPAPRPTASSRSAKPVPLAQLTLGVYGNAAELAAYRHVVATYNATSITAHVTLRTAATQDDLLQDVAKGGSEPDVFLAGRADLQGLITGGLIQPVDTYADQRGVDLGDDFSRDAIEALSDDHRLECLPYGIAPTVVFYNTALVDFDQMRAQGLDAPMDDTNTRWDLDQFTAAAKFATHDRQGSKGFYVPPTLAGLAPFVYSGGGDVYDDDQLPTSLDLASDASRSALATTLAVLRKPRLTLSAEQLRTKSPLAWFESGRLAMFTGTRDLVPELRKVSGLHFDVMPVPVLNSAATIGETTGLCLSAKPSNTAAAADLLVTLAGAESVSSVVAAGYLVPANQQVALTAAFLQPTQQPLHAEVFLNAIRSLREAPLSVGDGAQLQAAVGPTVRQLVDGGPTVDLAALTARIDAESIPVLAPPAPSASPTPSPTPN